jgi:hypothetical protein
MVFNWLSHIFVFFAVISPNINLNPSIELSKVALENKAYFVTKNLIAVRRNAS